MTMRLEHLHSRALAPLCRRWTFHPAVVLLLLSFLHHPSRFIYLLPSVAVKHFIRGFVHLLSFFFCSLCFLSFSTWWMDDQCVSVTFMTSPGLRRPLLLPTGSLGLLLLTHSFIHLFIRIFVHLVTQRDWASLIQSSGLCVQRISSNLDTFLSKFTQTLIKSSFKCPWQPEQGSTVVPVLCGGTSTLQ